ncbi:MAG: hypothetical protein NUW22_12565 [Acidobacteria bacterium]|nr:hypothetical protein [Acidobacteriota bacterium]
MATTRTTGELITAAIWNAALAGLTDDGLTYSGNVSGTITVADSTSATCFVGLWESATGNLSPKTDAGITYNASTGVLTATGFSGPLTGNVTGNASGTAATVTGATQAAITSAANLATVGTITSGVWNAGAVTSSGLLTVSGAGTHAFSASSTSANALDLLNSNTGANADAQFRVANTGASGGDVYIQAFSANKSTSGYVVTSGGAVVTDTVGGLSLGALHASGDVRLYSRNALAVTFGASQLATFTGAISVAGTSTVTGQTFATRGSVGAPGYSFVLDTDTGIYQSGDGNNAIQFVCGGAEIGGWSGASWALTLSSAARGTGAKAGPFIEIGRNSSGSGAAGAIYMTWLDGNTSAVWVDATGDLRIVNGSGNAPQEDGTPADTSGTVVGDQTSWYERKANIRSPRLSPTDALRRVIDAEISDYEFKSKGYLTPDGKSPQTFTGYVGRKRTDWFLKNSGPQQEPCLNEISILGTYALAFRDVDARLAQLERQIQRVH